MFKANTPIRRRVLEAVEHKLQIAEKQYEEDHKHLTDTHVTEIDDVIARHRHEHEVLLDKAVESIVSKIL